MGQNSVMADGKSTAAAPGGARRAPAVHELESARLTVRGTGGEREIAVLRRRGAAPGMFWLGGLRSDMTGTKATAVDAFAARRGLASTRFDYSGHGDSGGAFEEGTITRWLEEAKAVLDRYAQGPQVLIGSSMGAWLALLLAQSRARSARMTGLVLIAPALDMTRALMWDKWNKRARQTLMETGVYLQPNDYGEPYPITRTLIEDGDKYLIGERLIETGCPVHVLQGIGDREVPWRHAADLVSHLASDDVVLTLVKDGDHRLSRPPDIDRLESAIAQVLGETGH